MPVVTLALCLRLQAADDQRTRLSHLDHRLHARVWKAGMPKPDRITEFS